MQQVSQKPAKENPNILHLNYYFIYTLKRSALGLIRNNGEGVKRLEDDRKQTGTSKLQLILKYIWKKNLHWLQ